MWTAGYDLRRRSHQACIRIRRQSRIDPAAALAGGGPAGLRVNRMAAGDVLVEGAVITAARFAVGRVVRESW
jgi:hypothetical protein